MQEPYIIFEKLPLELKIIKVSVIYECLRIKDY